MDPSGFTLHQRINETKQKYYYHYDGMTYFTTTTISFSLTGLFLQILVLLKIRPGPDRSFKEELLL